MPSYQDTYQVEIIEPEIVEIIPHDSHAFTQGLLIHNGKIYESTGLYGESSLRIVNMSTGQIEKIVNLTVREYSNMLVTTKFWDQISGENILIFQTVRFGFKDYLL